jgi:WD40 repeat protein/serine/threonine protein kinase
MTVPKSDGDHDDETERASRRTEDALNGAGGIDPILSELDGQLASLLASGDETLAGEKTLPESGVSLGPTVRARLEQARDWIQLLKRAWRQQEETRAPLVEGSAQLTLSSPALGFIPESEETQGLPPGAAAGSAQGGDTPRRIGRFTIVEELGHGGFGIVYLAHDPALGRQVALKLPRAEVLASPELKRRFLTEARMAARIDHPNIMPIYDVGELKGDGGAPGIYIASAYCREGSLLAWIERQGAAIPPRSIARLMIGLAQGVQHLHELGILHRDLKPSNVLLQRRSADSGSTIAEAVPVPPDGGTGSSSLSGPDLEFVPRVADFGLARLRDKPLEQTLSGVPIGSPPYMSPEQAQGKVHALGPPTDIYGLGAILYTLLAGRPPFCGETAAETIRQVIQDEPVPPRRLRRKLPRDLETICLTCLRKEPERRYSSAGALRDDLHRFLHREPIRARPVSAAERLVKWRRRRPATALLVAARAVSLVAGTAGVLSQWRKAVAAREDLRGALIVSRSHENLARRNAERAERQAYIARINLAGRSWDDGNADEVLRLLEETKDLSRQADLRGFEWYYLDRLCHPASRTLTGHTSTVWSLAVHPRERVLASVGDTTLRIWDMASGREVLRVDHPGSVLGVAFSPKGDRLATSDIKGVIRIWDAVAGTKLFSFDEHRSIVPKIAFSPDGKLLASAGRGDGTVKLWELERRRLIRTDSSHKGAVFCVAFSPDGKLLASGGVDRSIRIREAATGQRRYDLEGHDSTVLHLAFSPDGTTLASAGMDGTVRLWDVRTGRPCQPVSTLQKEPNAFCVAFSPDGKLLAAGGDDQKVTLWDTARYKVVRIIRGHRRAVMDVAFSRDGKTLVSAGDVNPIMLWDLTVDQESRRLGGQSSDVADLAFSPQGNRLAATTDDGTVTLWDGEKESRIWSVRDPAREYVSIAFHPSGKRLALSGNDGTITLRDATNGGGPVIFKDPPPAGMVWSVAFSPDGKLLASANKNGTVTVREADSGVVLWSLRGHEGEATKVVFSPDGKLLASAGTDQLIWLWDLTTRRPVRPLRGHVDNILALSFSPDGKLLASGGFDLTIKVWSVSTGDVQHNLQGHAQAISDLAFSPDSLRLASAGGDKVVTLWDITLGQKLLDLRGHGSAVYAVAFRADGELLASGGRDRSIRLWEAARGRALSPQASGNGHQALP